MLPSEIISVAVILSMLLGFLIFVGYILRAALRDEEYGLAMVVLGMAFISILVGIGSYLESIGM